MKDKRSIDFRLFGLGYGGSRVCAAFHKEYGYEGYICNTAETDLGKITVPKGHKLLLKDTTGGAGRDMKVGELAFRNNSDTIRDFIRLHGIDKTEYAMLCVGGGGGTGTGGIRPIAEILHELGIEVGIIFTLPLESEDTETKKNCLIAIKQVYDSSIIKPIIIIDNAKISKKYPNLSIGTFWERSNKDIAHTFHIINKMSSQQGLVYSLDPADYRKIIRTPGCATMGEMSVKEFNSRDRLAESLRRGITEGLYASDFDFSDADKVGIVLRGAPSIFKKIAEKDISYAFTYIKEVSKANLVYWGIYADHAYRDRIRVHSIFSGLNLPIKKLQGLIEETKSEIKVFEEKKTTKKTELDFDFFFNRNKQSE